VKLATLPIEPEPSNVQSIAAARTRRATHPAEPALPVLPERPPLDGLFIARVTVLGYGMTEWSL
jgi:hypothetical protein